MFVEQWEPQKQDLSNTLYNMKTHFNTVSVQYVISVLTSKHSAIMKTTCQFLNGLTFSLEFT